MPVRLNRDPGELRSNRRESTRKQARRSRFRSSRATISSTWFGSSWPMRRRRVGPALPNSALGRSGKSNSIAWLAHQLSASQRRRPRISIRSSSSLTDVFSISKFATPSTVLLKSARSLEPCQEQVLEDQQLAKFIARWKEDHHLHRPDVPIYSRRNRRRTPRKEFRDHCR